MPDQEIEAMERSGIEAMRPGEGYDRLRHSMADGMGVQ